MKYQNRFRTSEVSQRSKVRSQIHSENVSKIVNLKKSNLFPISELSKSLNPLKISQTCCQVKSEIFLKGQNIIKNIKVS